MLEERWRSLLVLVVAAVAVLGLGVSPTGGGKAHADDVMFTYGCLAPVEVCVEAGLQATDAAGAAAYMSQYEAVPEEVSGAGVVRTNAAARPGGFGYILNPGSAQRRYFGWRFSRGGFGRQLPFERCARLSSGRLVNCQFVGNIGFQANFNLRNRFVLDLGTNVKSFVDDPLSVTSTYTCNGPVSCGSPTNLTNNIEPEGTAAASFREFQVAGSGSYDLTFQWSVFDPRTQTSAWTPRYDSIDFVCTPVRSSADPGDCFYTAGTRGDAK